MCLWSQLHLKSGLLFIPTHVRSRHTDATWGVMEAYQSLPVLCILFSPNNYVPNLFYTQLYAYIYYQLLVWTSCQEVPFSTTVNVPQSGLWITSLISSFLTPVALLSHVIMLTQADHSCPGCNYACMHVYVCMTENDLPSQSAVAMETHMVVVYHMVSVNMCICISVNGTQNP